MMPNNLNMTNMQMPSIPFGAAGGMPNMGGFMP